MRFIIIGFRLDFYHFYMCLRFIPLAGDIHWLKLILFFLFHFLLLPPVYKELVGRHFLEEQVHMENVQYSQ